MAPVGSLGRQCRLAPTHLVALIELAGFAGSASVVAHSDAPRVRGDEERRWRLVPMGAYGARLVVFACCVYQQTAAVCVPAASPAASRTLAHGVSAPCTIVPVAVRLLAAWAGHLRRDRSARQPAYSRGYGCGRGRDIVYARCALMPVSASQRGTVGRCAHGVVRGAVEYCAACPAALRAAVQPTDCACRCRPPFRPLHAYVMYAGSCPTRLPADARKRLRCGGPFVVPCGPW
jgi:hypothetical protein